MLWVYHDGPAPLIVAMCRAIGLTKTINQMLRWDPSQCKLSPGSRIEAIIVNALTNRRPLYRLEEFFRGMDVEKLFGPGIEAADLNDDSIGRALDKLAEAGPKEVYCTVALRAALKEGVGVDVIHADTTSVSVEGAYDDDDVGEILRITYGHSKDNRPDLKQFLYGLAVTKDGVPVIGEVLDGNTSDRTWNHQMIDSMRSRLGDLKDLVYVADSSLVTGPNLKKMKEEGIHFISRLPATYSIEGELKERAHDEGKWKEVGALGKRKDAASYRVSSYDGFLDGTKCRFVVVHSSKLDQRKEKAFERELSREEDDLQRRFRELQRREFFCEPDAHEAWREFSKDKSPYFTLSYEVVSDERAEKRPCRGRPPKEYVPEVKRFYSIRPKLQRDEAAIRTRKSRLSSFVLITNILDEEAWPDERILKEYKEQTVVEQHFSFIKSPKVVGPIYLKNPERVAALAYVFLMALLVYSLIQRRARLALKGQEKPLLIYDNRKTFEPTGRSVLDLFVNMMVANVDGERVIPSNLKVPRYALSLLGFSEQVYLRWMPP